MAVAGRGPGMGWLGGRPPFLSTLRPPLHQQQAAGAYPDALLAGRWAADEGARCPAAADLKPSCSPCLDPQLLRNTSNRPGGRIPSSDIRWEGVAAGSSRSAWGWLKVSILGRPGAVARPIPAIPALYPYQRPVWEGPGGRLERLGPILHGGFAC
jgi:hypothetical protein